MKAMLHIIIMQNIMHDYDKVNNEITDLEFDLSAARKQLYRLEANKQASEVTSGCPNYRKS